jgi:hypothetical protein
MYIPDEHWDKIVGKALDLIETPDVAANDRLFNILYHLINLDDVPIPRKKRATRKGFHKIRKGREYMRKFTQYFVTRLAADKINKIKKRKRKSVSSIKSVKLIQS